MRSKKDMMCSCGKRKGACNCKGYAYGSEKIQGYYMGDTAVATPQEQQEMMAMQPGVRMQAPAPTPEGPNELQQAVKGVAMSEALSPVTDYVKDQGSMAFSSAKDLIGGQALGTNAAGAAGQAAQEAAIKSAEAAGKSATETGLSGIKAGADAATAAQGATEAAKGLGSSALSGFGGAAAADLLTKGKVDEKTLLKGGLAMGANMLLPGSGFLVGPAMSALGLKDGMMEVPPVGYADGTAKMTPVEERPMLQAPLLLAAEEPDYRRLSSGGMADLNFSKRTLEQNKKAREDNYKRIQKAMQAAQ
jgi:hypothetical protein